MQLSTCQNAPVDMPKNDYIYIYIYIFNIAFFFLHVDGSYPVDSPWSTGRGFRTSFAKVSVGARVTCKRASCPQEMQACHNNVSLFLVVLFSTSQASAVDMMCVAKACMKAGNSQVAALNWCCDFCATNCFWVCMLRGLSQAELLSRCLFVESSIFPVYVWCSRVLSGSLLDVV